MFGILTACSMLLLMLNVSAGSDQQDKEAAVAEAIAKSKQCRESAVVTELPEPFNLWLTLSCGSTGQLIMGNTAAQGEQFVARRSIAPMNIYGEMNPQKRVELIQSQGMDAVTFMRFDGVQLSGDDARKFQVGFEQLFEGYESDADDELWLLQIVGQSADALSHLVLLVKEQELRYAIHMRGEPQNTGVYMAIDEVEWNRRAESRLNELKAMAEAENKTH